MINEAVKSAPGQNAPSTADAVERGTYEILRARLAEHARTLAERAEALNRQRLEIFGGAEMAVIGNERIRTENNCVPRDVRAVGRHLLFGYNVFIGLKTETRVDDVLSLHTFAERDGGFAFDPVPADAAESFLTDPEFVRDFQELYKYYKDTRLLQLRRTDGKLLAVFQTGASLKDLKVFRWAVDPRGRATYVDNRGERDHVFPPSHDFEWTATTRDHHVHGRHPHVNVLDQVFVETVGGDLTVKVEDNTEDGLGIYREPVDEPHQSLDDAEIHYAAVGTLILLKVRPYNERAWRYLVFNPRTRRVDRIDAIGRSCVLLPEDHGLIFPGGYYLQSGETKTFDGDVAQMELLQVRRSPNGEDVIYVFHERRSGLSILLPYNMIRKQVQNPIHCHGYTFFDDGRLVIFRALSDEPTRVHPMQIWQTPFLSDEVAARAPSRGTYLEKVGNAELVRGISDALSLHRAAERPEPTAADVEELIASAVRIGDAYHWLGRTEVGDLAAPLAALRAAAEQILDEVEKVQAIRRRAREAVAEAEAHLDELCTRLRRAEMASIDALVDGLAQLRRQRGHLITLKEVRYVDGDKVAALEERLIAAFDELSGRTVAFLGDAAALAPYRDEIARQTAAVEGVAKTADARPIREALGAIGDGLELLTEVVGGLTIDDPTVRTRILEAISEVLAALNRGRALLEARRKELAAAEGTAEFGAQLRLFSQSVSSALALADTPEKCDEQLAKLMLQLEELESRFGEVDELVEQIAVQREDVYEALATRKQALLDERQRHAGRMLQAAERILDGVRRRAAALASLDELNAYFAGDAMVTKVRDLARQLREIHDSVKADELEARLKSTREDAGRTLRDRRDLFEEGAEVIRLGRHRFSVNTQPFELTLVPRGEGGEQRMTLHLTGTDFYQEIADPELDGARDYWDQRLVSESAEVYRGEFLATAVLAAAVAGRGASLDELRRAKLGDGELLAAVRRHAAERYDEGYERGLHDHDATLILEQLLGQYETAGLLRFLPRPRAVAALFWAFCDDQAARAAWQLRARSLARLRSSYAGSPAIADFARELAAAVERFAAGHGLELRPGEADAAGGYLFEELSAPTPRFAVSKEALTLRDAFLDDLRRRQSRRDFDEELRQLAGDLRHRYQLVAAWLRAFLADRQADGVGAEANEKALDTPTLDETALDEAAALLLTDRQLERAAATALPRAEVAGLLSQHPRIKERRMTVRLDELLARLDLFRRHRVPGFKRFQQLRHELLERARRELRLGEYQPRVMSAFVRNRLIDEVYLPLIGDNLAKQMGALGEGKRTDQMGLLLLISPPGYGKTTLMEYVASRLGLVFVKVNGPALGHGVTSLDPAEAPNATARQEVEKIGFALEMANNVLLYLDDIQHTHPELLQKFISLCDAQRRIEGVWRGATRTYDLRGKRFAVCMAGNPYTESGAKFQIPDMLANRADTYNLGDILTGRDALFALSYLENALTSNPVLAPLAGRELRDVHQLARMARGEEVPPDELSHGYSAVEIEEILAVLRQLLAVQQLLLRVNQQYIASAAQDDAYRTEPRFQLQGSYRNMNKLAEKVVPVMNDRELAALVDDHYQGEAQTLTTGAEHNLLKLKELRGTLEGEEHRRWEEIKRGFARVQAMGGAEEDPAVRLIGQLGLVSDRLHDIGAVLRTAAAESAARVPEKSEEPKPQSAIDGAGLAAALTPYLEQLQLHLGTLAEHAVRAGAAPAPSAAPEPAPISAAAPPPLDLSPYLERLDQTLQGLATATRGGQIVQSLNPGVHELLTSLVTTIGDDLLPLVKGLGRQLRSTDAAGERKLTQHLDRTLKNLDMLKDLVTSLRRLDTRELTASS